MAEINKNGQIIPIDPRTALLLLLLVTIAVFSQHSFYVEIATLLVIFGLFLYGGLAESGLKFVLQFGFLLLLQYAIFPVAPKLFTDTFSILAAYARKVLPCAMMGAFLVKRIPMRYIVLAMRKWRFPQKLIIPLSVTIRYFPAIREEMGYIRDAMKLRRISGAARIEAYIVPLMFSAANTAEELGAAAVTRGIENPAPKTSVIELRLCPRDYVLIGCGIVLAAAAFHLR